MEFVEHGPLMQSMVFVTCILLTLVVVNGTNKIRNQDSFLVMHVLTVGVLVKNVHVMMKFYKHVKLALYNLLEQQKSQNIQHLR